MTISLGYNDDSYDDDDDVLTETAMTIVMAACSWREFGVGESIADLQ